MGSPVRKSALLGDDVAQVGEGRVHDVARDRRTAQTTSSPRRAPRGHDRYQGGARAARRVEQRGAVAAAAQRGVDEHASALAGEELDDLSFENWLVVVVLGHLQPFNRRTAESGRRRMPSTRLDDCQAAHGPRPVLLIALLSLVTSLLERSLRRRSPGRRRSLGFHSSMWSRCPDDRARRPSSCP